MCKSCAAQLARHYSAASKLTIEMSKRREIAQLWAAEFAEGARVALVVAYIY